ncbi:exported hypothetical protein [Magnetospirillum sp. UT-4]|nr:exported hypothetical protein [Magnetospirillum sp. UT-4]
MPHFAMLMAFCLVASLFACVAVLGGAGQ